MYSTLNRRQLLGRLYANASIYGLGIILVRAGSILLLPLYWLRLEPSDYGVIGLTQAVSLFLSPVLGMGMVDAVQRFYYDWRVEERPHYLAAVWLFVLAVSALVCGMLDLAGSRLFALLFDQVAFDPYLRIAIWTAFATNLSMLPLMLLRVREQLRRYSYIVLGQFLTQTGVTLYLIFALDMGVTGICWVRSSAPDCGVAILLPICCVRRGGRCSEPTLRNLCVMPCPLCPRRCWTG